MPDAVLFTADLHKLFIIDRRQVGVNKFKQILILSKLIEIDSRCAEIVNNSDARLSRFKQLVRQVLSDEARAAQN